MDSIERQWLVARLAGYVVALASIDGVFGNSIAGAYIVPLDENALFESLKSHLQEKPANKYSYSAITKIHKPWVGKLQIALEGFFLQRPFGMPDVSNSEQLKHTRENLVLRIVDMIGMATDDFSCEGIFCLDMRSNNGYCGHMYVFPLHQDFLVLKMLAR